MGSVVVSAESVQDARWRIDTTADEIYDMADLSEQMPYVVAVDEINKKTGLSNRLGTGTLIDGHVLTAGHVYEYPANTTPGEPCKHSLTATRDTLAEDVNKTQLQEIALQAMAAESFHDDEHPVYEKPDWALFKTGTEAGLPRSVIADVQPSIGDVVTFTNYQTVASTSRSKHPQNRHPALQDNRYNDQAIFNGLVLSDQRGERMAILTSFSPSMTYSYPGDYTLIGGGSGGPVWNLEGKLVGMSNNKTIDSKSPAEVEAEFGVDLIGVDPSDRLAIDWMQPVGQKDFANLETNLQSCDFDPDDLNRIRAKQPFKLQK